MGCIESKPPVEPTNMKYYPPIRSGATVASAPAAAVANDGFYKTPQQYPQHNENYFTPQQQYPQQQYYPQQYPQQQQYYPQQYYPQQYYPQQYYPQQYPQQNNQMLGTAAAVVGGILVADAISDII
jgi:hypothetical protein